MPLQVSLGADVSLAVGPVGRAGALSMNSSTEMEISSVLSYSHSRGLLAGLSLESAVIAARPEVRACAGFPCLILSID